jgi:hypothetical protein
MSSRRIVWIDSNEFCGFACAACSWRFAVPGVHNSDGLPVELARSRYDHHDCADYWVTTTAVVGALEQAVAQLSNVVSQCRCAAEQSVMLQEESALYSAAADCDGVRSTLTRILEGLNRS